MRRLPKTLRLAFGMLKYLKMYRQEVDTMGENGRIFYQQELSLAVGAKRFA